MNRLATCKPRLSWVSTQQAAEDSRTSRAASAYEKAGQMPALKFRGFNFEA